MPNAAVWGRGRSRRCPELVSTLLTKGHRTDPKMALTYQRLQQLRRWGQEDPTSAKLIERAWELLPAIRSMPKPCPEPDDRTPAPRAHARQQ